MTEPMPPVQEDPATVAAREAQASYAARAASIRGDVDLSDLAKAEQITAAHEETLGEMEQQHADLTERRQARLAHIQAMVPNGPGVPEDASPADRAVLAAAFRSSLEQARNASLDQRKQMLADALKYGDDAQLRGVLAAADELGEGQLLDQWAEATGNTEVVQEGRGLVAQLSGMDSASRGWEWQAFRAPGRPSEAANLPVLRQRAEQERQREAAARSRIASAHFGP